RIDFLDRFGRSECEPRGKPPVQRSVQRAIGENRDPVGKEDGRGIAPRLIEALVAEPDALPPSEPMTRAAGTRARRPDAGLPTQGAEHHRDPRAHVRKRYRMLGMDRIARGATDQAMPGATNGLFQLEEIEHQTTLTRSRRAQRRAAPP